MGQKVGSVRWASTFVTYCMGEPRWIRRVYANAQSSRNGVVDRPLAWYPGDPTLIPDNLQQGYSFLQLKLFKTFRVLREIVHIYAWSDINSVDPGQMAS